MGDRPGGYTLAPGAEWTDKAATWPVVFVTRETGPGHWLTDVVPATPTGPLTQVHACCAVCPDVPSLFCVIPDTQTDGYRLMWADVLSGILAHIRRTHET